MKRLCRKSIGIPFSEKENAWYHIENAVVLNSFVLRAPFLFSFGESYIHDLFGEIWEANIE